MQKTTLKQRLAEFLEYLEIGQAKFAENVGVSKGFANNVGDSIRADNLKKITDVYPDLNTSWLLTGVGEMLKSDNADNTAVSGDIEIPNDGTYRLVPLINSDAVGGMYKLNDINAEPEYIIKYIPFTDAFEGDVCIRVTSNSMTPTCPSGCVVQIREVLNWREYFGYGNLFVLQLKDGRRIIKEVAKYIPNSKDYVLCVSHNKEIAEEELPKSFIVSVWKVIKVLNDIGW